MRMQAFPGKIRPNRLRCSCTQIQLAPITPRDYPTLGVKMKPATVCMWAFIGFASLTLVKSVLLIREVPDFEHQQLGTRMQLVSSILFLCAVGCAIVRAIGMRNAGQASAMNKAIENETVGS